MVAKSSGVPQRPSRLRDKWWWWWWYFASHISFPWLGKRGKSWSFSACRAPRSVWRVALPPSPPPTSPAAATSTTRQSPKLHGRFAKVCVEQRVSEPAKPSVNQSNGQSVDRSTHKAVQPSHQIRPNWLPKLNLNSTSIADEIKRKWNTDRQTNKQVLLSNHLRGYNIFSRIYPILCNEQLIMAMTLDS